MIAYGIQSSSTAIVGAHIGAGRIETAKLYYKSILSLSSIILAIELTLLLNFRKEIFSFFTKNDDILNVGLSATIFTIIVISQDFIQGVLYGTIKALTQ